MSWAEKYLTVPFAEKGRSMEGADCWGLVQLIYKQELGIDLPSYLECYETTNDRDVLGKLIADERGAKWSEPKSPQEYDIIILNMRGVPMHVGIVLPGRRMLHCARGVGTVIERYDGLKWQLNVMGFARYG